MILGTVLTLVLVISFTSTAQIKKEFRRYRIQPNGCDIYKEVAKLPCSSACALSADCVTFSYDAVSKMCKTCRQGNITAASNDAEMYWLRTTSLFKFGSGSVSIVLDQRILMRILATLLPTNTTNWTVIEVISSMVNYTIPLRMSLDYSNTVGVSATGMGGKLCCKSQVNFTAGAEIDITVVNIYPRFSIYINNFFCCNSSYLGPSNIPSRIFVFAGLKLKEFSS